MRAADIIERAKGPAVLTDRLNRTVALNLAASKFLKHSHASAAGQDFYELLEVRDVFGNRVNSHTMAFLDMLARGERISDCELQLKLGSGATARAMLSVVVFSDSSSSNVEFVYLMTPVSRRRRADEAIEVILNRSGSPTGIEISELRNGRLAEQVGLTRRQKQVLGLLADGKSPKEIAGELGVSVNTVRTHINAILHKLDAHSQLEAVAIALRSRIV
jgi:DNA-binding CsgD family transcriptional regulator